MCIRDRYNTFFREYSTSNGSGVVPDEEVARGSSISPGAVSSAALKSKRRRSKALSEEEQVENRSYLRHEKNHF